MQQMAFCLSGMKVIPTEPKQRFQHKGLGYISKVITLLPRSNAKPITARGSDEPVR